MPDAPPDAPSIAAPPIGPRVEFYGVARLLAGCPAVTLDLGAATLPEVVRALADRLPALVGPVLDPVRGTTADGYLFNRNGRDFLTDPAAVIRPGARVLLLASVAGG